ncbi:MAG: hypothetical protein LV481_09815 [Methylacidiphilales bacterium]|nr:hypothetical protein [Candidatus Methylacidiphilales bacterium]
MSSKTYLAMLAKAFVDLHGCEARHLKTVPVIERWQGKTVWEGEVEVFDLIGHRATDRGYAWASDNKGKKTETEVVAVLELPPVLSPQTAVKVALIGLAKSKKKGSRTGELYKRYFYSKVKSGDLRPKPR